MAPVVQPTARLIFNYQGMDAHDPVLFPLGGRVIAGARFGPTELNGSAVIGHGPVEAFGPWPPDPAFLYETTLEAWPNPPIYSPSEDETFAVSYVDWPGCVHTIGSGLEPEGAYSGGLSYPAGFVGGLGCFRGLRAVVGRPGEPHFVASVVQNPALGDGYLLETVATNADGTSLTYDTPACSLSPLWSDIERADGEIVIATSNATPAIQCQDELGVPASVAVGRFGSGEATFTAATVDDVVAVDLVARPSGAWLLFRESGASARVAPPVMAVALGSDLQPVTDIVPATGEALGRFAAAPVAGGGLAVVSDERLRSTGSLSLRVFGPDGTLQAEVQVPTGEPPLPQERLALVTSTDGGSAVVAWTGPAASPASQIVGARVDCLF